MSGKAPNSYSLESLYQLLPDRPSLHLEDFLPSGIDLPRNPFGASKNCGNRGLQRSLLLMSLGGFLFCLCQVYYAHSFSGVTKSSDVEAQQIDGPLWSDIRNVASFLEKEARIRAFRSLSEVAYQITGDMKYDDPYRNSFDLSRQPSFGIGLDNITQKDKYYIYRCDQKTLFDCGGWIDRLKGIAAAYLTANLTGRTFKIEIEMNSCDFHKYVEPNHVDWYLPISLHKTITAGKYVQVFPEINDRSFLTNVNHTYTELNKTYVYYKGNVEYFSRFKRLRHFQEPLAWMNHLDYTEIVNAIYRRLFKPSNYLQQETKAFLAKNVMSHQKLVCAHLRTGPNPTMPEDFAYYFVTKLGLRRAWIFLRDMSRKFDSKIFLMSDSMQVLNRAKRMPYRKKVFISPGKVIHIDRSVNITHEERCKGLEKIILEHNVLLHCDVLLISRSGIGIHAASVRDSDKGLYCLHDNGVLAPCKVKQLVEVFKLHPFI